jgi:Protein of unknown function (DUF1588)/Protein of unknown function (DUF1592)
MNTNRRSSASLCFTGAAACLSLLAGCLEEQHLVGEDLWDASAHPGTTTDGKPTTPDGMPTTPDGMPTTPDGMSTTPDGMPTTPDAGVAVVPLGGHSNGGWPITISPAEVARRLSSFVFQKPPSTAFIAAVTASAPRTNEDVGELTDGLLLDEASVAGRHAFYRWWLGLDAFALAQRDATLFPAFTPAVASALVDQVLMFAEDVTWRPEGDLTTLFTEPAAFVTSETAAWFPGVSTPSAAAGATRVALDATYYAGLVTQPAVVATVDYANRTEPAGRGMKVWGRYWCQPVPPEPANSPPPAIPMGKTTRQWEEEANLSVATCAPCHGLIDPPGFAFGHFDAVGAFQETEGGLPVDTTGVLPAWKDQADADLSFTGAPDLATQLAAQPAVSACFAAKWLAFSTGKYATVSADSVSVSDAGLTDDADYVVKRATIQGRLNLRGAIRAVTETHTFLDP